MIERGDAPDEDKSPRAQPDAIGGDLEPDIAGELATLQNWLDLDVDNVIGIFGKPNEMQALLRSPDGEILKLRTGDAALGGHVQAIDEERVVIVKDARAFTLRIGKAPRAGAKRSSR